jgi:gamma-glutamyltranspeptidase/glutathione hydrolase
MSQGGVVASGHYLATKAAGDVFRGGGTAIDAGIAAGIALGVLLYERVNFAGVAPIILHHATSRRTVTIDGLGRWPRLTDVDFLRGQERDGLGTTGLFRVVTPGAPDAWLTALAEFGTLSAGDVLEPSWELAALGAPVGPLAAFFWTQPEAISPWPVDMSLFASESFPAVGEVMKRPELAAVIKALMDEEALARKRGLDRREAIYAARDLFYKGWIAEEIGAFYESVGGWLRYDDLATYSVEIGIPLTTSFRGYEVLACGPWCQGPILLQFLNILEEFDLRSLGHNSVDYLHVVAEGMNLAFADREAFYGDPDYVSVPIDALISKEYGRQRAKEISDGAAFGRLPRPGDAFAFSALSRPSDPAGWEPPQPSARTPSQPDTSYVATVDDLGNVFSATPSDSSLWGTTIPKLGFSVSGRGINSRIEAGHPSVAAPGKRPRLTPNPALVAKDGTPFMAFGCPGGDAQSQGMLQFLLNLLEFGMNPQQAIEAPRIASWNFPNTFAPHGYLPGRLQAERRIPKEVLDVLARRGHDVEPIAEFTQQTSAVHAALINPANGVLIAASDPRAEGDATGCPRRAPLGAHPT